MTSYGRCAECGDPFRRHRTGRPRIRCERCAEIRKREQIAASNARHGHKSRGIRRQRSRVDDAIDTILEILADPWI